MTKKELIFDGKEKKIYATEDPDVVLFHFKDIATAFGGIKKAIIKDKGKFNNRISAIVFKRLAEKGIPTHFISLAGEREQLCRKIELIPIQIIVRNRICGTTARMLGMQNGSEIPNTVFELRYNNDELGDPLINDHHVVALGLLTYAELGYMYDIARKVNDALIGLFHEAGIELIDFKMECGRSSDGEIIVSDEISPDNARLWDEKTGEQLDKDRFRHDMGEVCISYKTVMDRLIKATEK